MPLVPKCWSEDKLISAWAFIKSHEEKFWARFVDELVPRLERMPKWVKQKFKPYEGQLVLSLDKTKIPFKWSRARITELILSRDGIVRSVMLRSKDCKEDLERSVSDIYPLFPEDL